jgi:hypothetical protein
VKSPFGEPYRTACFRRARIGDNPNVRRVAIRTSALALVIVWCASCVGPARTYDDYRLKAKSTAETTRSAIGTAQLAIEAATHRRAFGPYLSVLVADAESDATGAQTAFDSVQPPDDRADQLRKQTDDLLQQATDALAALRISARRGHFANFAAEQENVDAIADELDRFIEEHS